jgi:hypothetical protein
MQTIPKARLRSGQFAPGQSGNPGGRPKDEHRVAELARSYTLEAIDTLVELMRDGKDERVRGTAAQALLDRAWGKAKLDVVTGAEGSYLDVLRAVNERLVRGKRFLRNHHQPNAARITPTMAKAIAVFQQKRWRHILMLKSPNDY